MSQESNVATVVQITTAAWIQSLAPELLHTMGMAKKRKKIETKLTFRINLIFYVKYQMKFKFELHQISLRLFCHHVL